MREILVATDLTARSDRAFDRAASLAAETGARLTVVHAIEDVRGLDESVSVPSWRRDKPAWKRMDALKAAAEEEIRAQLGPRAPALDVVVQEEKAADLVLRIASERSFDLVVTGVARGEGAGRVVLGSTVERLIKSAAAPVLVVKRRPRGPYDHVLAATDLSPTSARAFASALELFPQAEFDLLHAYETEEEGMSARPGVREQDPAYRTAQSAAREFVAEAAGSSASKVRLVLEPGSPLSLANAYVAEHGVDLIALGTHGRTGFFARLMGSVAEKVLLTCPCDALVVRGTGA